MKKFFAPVAVAFICTLVLAQSSFASDNDEALKASRKLWQTMHGISHAYIDRALIDEAHQSINHVLSHLFEFSALQDLWIQNPTVEQYKEISNLVPALKVEFTNDLNQLASNIDHLMQNGFETNYVSQDLFETFIILWRAKPISGTLTNRGVEKLEFAQELTNGYRKILITAVTSGIHRPQEHYPRESGYTFPDDDSENIARTLIIHSRLDADLQDQVAEQNLHRYFAAPTSSSSRKFLLTKSMLIRLAGNQFHFTDKFRRLALNLDDSETFRRVPSFPPKPPGCNRWFDLTK